jgi:hypothetical protein
MFDLFPPPFAFVFEVGKFILYHSPIMAPCPLPISQKNKNPKLMLEINVVLIATLRDTLFEL